MRVDLSLDTGLDIDAACFGLDSARRLSDERYMVFFNQPSSPCGAVRQVAPHAFEFDLARVPESIDAFVLTLATEAADGLKRLGRSEARLGETQATTCAQFAFDGSLFPVERAVMLIEIYRKEGRWRLSPVAQGFQGGLAGLVQHFGGTVAEASSSVAAPALPAAVPAPAPAPVSLSKITLDKPGDKISLEKRGAKGHGRIVCNLRWNVVKPSGLGKWLGGSSGGRGARVSSIEDWRGAGLFAAVLNSHETAG